MSEPTYAELQAKIEALEDQVHTLEHSRRRRSIRRRSASSFGGMPLYDIAVGPDPARGEIRGHARGIIAIGDIATGVLALGGLARGLIAFGGVAVGGVALGGCAFGVLTALGGLAVGGLALGGLAIGLVAIGGGAIGVVALGGGAMGYYACGGGALGKYVLSGVEQDPEAIRFFAQWIPGVNQLAPAPRR